MTTLTYKVTTLDLMKTLGDLNSYDEITVRNGTIVAISKAQIVERSKQVKQQLNDLASFKL